MQVCVKKYGSIGLTRVVYYKYARTFSATFHAHTQTQTDRQTDRQTDTQTHARTHTHIHTHTHTHTHAYTHTHTHPHAHHHHLPPIQHTHGHKSSFTTVLNIALRPQTQKHISGVAAGHIMLTPADVGGHWANKIVTDQSRIHNSSLSVASPTR
jgi:hypothetical protein